MRRQLFYNPRLLCERLATESVGRRRLAELRGTPGANLKSGHIDTLELVKLARHAGIKVVYDIGANAGTFSLLAKSVLGDVQIHAFEPLAEHQAQFVRTFAGDARVILHPVAVGSDNKEGTLHVTEYSDESSLLPPSETGRVHFGTREVNRIPLQIFRLDDYRRAKHLPFPDLIKLDIQGYELEALRGGTECLGSAKAVIAEVSFVEYYEGQCLFHDVVGFLAACQFFVRAFGVNTPTGETLGQTDVLFMRRA
jgi:FkbM family methyltransferase